jgi:hypothetical protein
MHWDVSADPSAARINRSSAFNPFGPPLEKTGGQITDYWERLGAVGRLSHAALFKSAIGKFRLIVALQRIQPQFEPA